MCEYFILDLRKLEGYYTKTEYCITFDTFYGDIKNTPTLLKVCQLLAELQIFCKVNSYHRLL